MKRISALLLAVLMLVSTVSLVSCGNNVNDGDYQLISTDADPFDFYVPKTWNKNNSGGVVSAYYSSQDMIMVSANADNRPVDTELSIYVDAVLTSYATLDGFEKLAGPAQTTLASLPAYSFDYKMTSSNKEMKCRTIVAKYETYFVVISYCAKSEKFDTVLGDFEDMLANFSFRPIKNDGETFVFYDEDTPTGYKLAMKPKYEFRLYVPETWRVDTSSQVPTAFCGKYADFSNISLISIMPTNDVSTGREYWNQYVDIMGDTVTNVAINENAKFGGYDAFEVSFVRKVSGLEYHIRQTFLSTSSMIYILTYTSDSENYSKYLGEVDTVLSMFEFKK